jgi:hypothetical protein
MNTRTLLAAVAGLALTVAGAQAACAQDFAQTHPHRAEVNQHKRIAAERHHAMRRSAHISKVRHARLNHREHAVSHRIG